MRRLLGAAFALIGDGLAETASAERRSRKREGAGFATGFGAKDVLATPAKEAPGPQGAAARPRRQDGTASRARSHGQMRPELRNSSAGSLSNTRAVSPSSCHGADRARRRWSRERRGGTVRKGARSCRQSGVSRDRSDRLTARRDGPLAKASQAPMTHAAIRQAGSRRRHSASR